MKRDRHNPQKNAFLNKIARKTQRKLKAQQSRTEAWLGLRMSGLVGWAVTLPTMLGVALGVWIDRQYPGQYSWTLMLMLMGLGLGCLNAWYWVTKESRHD